MHPGILVHSYLHALLLGVPSSSSPHHKACLELFSDTDWSSDFYIFFFSASLEDNIWHHWVGALFWWMHCVVSSNKFKLWEGRCLFHHTSLLLSEGLKPMSMFSIWLFIVVEIKSSNDKVDENLLFWVFTNLCRVVNLYSFLRSNHWGLDENLY